MSQRKLTFPELLDLIDLDGHRGIIDRDSLLKTLLETGVPRAINDIRGALRMAVERDGEGFSVTQYPTDLANESLNEIY